MSELGETFKAMREERKRRRAEALPVNQKHAAIEGIPYEVKNNGHHYVYTVGSAKFDYWPSSEKYCVRSKKHYGRGWSRLLKMMWAEYDRQKGPKP